MPNPATTEIQTWPIEKFIPYLRNPRKNDGVVDQMRASIQEFGFKIPMLARSDGTVVDGHLRLKAAKSLGLPELPVILCDEWTKAQVKAFRLMVNRSVTWASWDVELLAVEMLDLKGLDFNLALTGFETKEIDGFMQSLSDTSKEDEIPPTPVNPTTRPGDVWLMGECVCPHCGGEN